MKKIILLLVPVIVILLLAPQTAALGDDSFVDLGTLGGANSEAYAINDRK